MQLIGGSREGSGGDVEFSSGTGGAPARRETSGGASAGPGSDTKGGGAAKKNVDDFDDDIPF